MNVAKVLCQTATPNFMWPVCGGLHSGFLDIAQQLRVDFFFLSFYLFRAAPSTYGGSQARGLIGTVVASLHHSHSNAESKLHL